MGKAGFRPTLHSIFSSFRPWTAPSFIGGGREKSYLHWGKISALDSVGKDLNRWFKIGILSYQICRKRLTRLAFLGRCWCRWAVIQPKRAI
jgi:hypothetical protein